MEIIMSKTTKRVMISLLGVILLLIIAIHLILPVVDLPSPKGKYQVGTQLFSFTDNSRKEIYANSNTQRMLPVQVWYPTEEKFCGDKEPEFYMEKESCKNFERVLGIPYLLRHLASVKTNSYKEVPISNQEHKYPVVIFSHGYTGLIGQNTVQMETLASNGYIVFSIAHTYEAAESRFPDGVSIPFSEEQSNKLDDDWDKYSYLEGASNYEYYKQTLDEKGTVFESLNVWRDDTIFVANQIEKLNKGEILSQFKGKLDVNNMGIFGHSFGGATAGQACAADKRFKAGINMDGSPFLVYNNLSQPFMLMTSSESKKSIIDGYHPKQKMLIVAVNDAEHNDFTDMTMLLPGLKSIGLDVLGKIDGDKQENIMNEYILSFFNKYLKGIKEPLIDNRIDRYPEVTTELR